MPSMFYEPALAILKENAPQPMTPNSIMKKILELYPDIVWSSGQAPIRGMLLDAATMQNSHIRRDGDTSPPSFFYQETIDSSAPEEMPDQSPEEIMEEGYKKATESLKEELRTQIQKMEDATFEELVNQLISKMGFGRAETTQRSNDGGIDGYIYGDRLGLSVICVQSKHYSDKNVDRPEIQKFIGALHGHDGVFVTSSDFTSKATDEAKSTHQPRLVLINGEQLLDLMIEYNVGVQDTGTKYVLKRVDSDFFNELS